MPAAAHAQVDSSSRKRPREPDAAQVNELLDAHFNRQNQRMVLQIERESMHSGAAGSAAEQAEAVEAVRKKVRASVAGDAERKERNALIKDASNKHAEYNKLISKYNIDTLQQQKSYADNMVDIHRQMLEQVTAATSQITSLLHDIRHPQPQPQPAAFFSSDTQ